MDIENLTAADLMTPGVQKVKPDESLREAARRMCRARVQCLMIDPPTPDRAPGVITCKDIVQFLDENAVEVLEEIQVREAMTSPSITVPAHLCIRDCIKMMRITGVRRVFVVKDMEAVGVLSYADVLGCLARDE